MITRRNFIKNGALLPSVGRFATLLGAVRMLGPSPAHANPALMLIATLANYVASFVRGDGGMGAMYNAINAKLDLVIQSLAVLEVALADMMQKIDALPSEVDELLKKQYIEKEISVMKGSIQEYLEVQRELERRRKNGKLPKSKWDSRTEDQIRDIYQRFNSARRSLQNSPTGLRPDVAVFAPIAFTFDLAINLIAGSTNDHMIEIVKGYKSWFSLITNHAVGNSTANYILSARARHDSALISAQKTQAGKNLPLGDNPPDSNHILQYSKCLRARNFEFLRGNIPIITDFASDDLVVELIGNELNMSDDITLNLFVVGLIDVPLQLDTAPDIPPGCKLHDFWFQNKATLKALLASDDYKSFKGDFEYFEKQLGIVNIERQRIGAFCAANIAALEALQQSNVWLERFGA